MEQLINKVLTRGSGRKSNLEIKIFGGGMINAALSDVGAKNIEFVRQFLARRRLSGRQRGCRGARSPGGCMFKPHSGRALVKRLDAQRGEHRRH